MFHSHVRACPRGRVLFVGLRCSNDAAVTAGDGRGPVTKVTLVGNAPGDQEVPR